MFLCICIVHSKNVESIKSLFDVFDKILAETCYFFLLFNDHLLTTDAKIEQRTIDRMSSRGKIKSDVEFFGSIERISILFTHSDR